MRRFWLPAVVLLLTTPGIQGQSSPTPLQDGQQVTITGTLVMEPANRLQFVTVKTAAAFVPVFKGVRGSKDEQGEVLHEIGLAGYHDYALLYAHRGQTVTVAGGMSTDNASPYFWHGTRLEAKSIRLSGGKDLLGERRAREPIAIDTGSYEATAVLPGDLSTPWVYSANGRVEMEGRFLSCSSNGGGDVVNCSCADGFHPVSGESLIRGRREKAGLFKDMSFAQFGVGEEQKPPEVRLSVTCSR